MAWNDPDGNERDPWGGRRHDQGPPDLDEVVRKVQERLSRLFGGRSGPQPDGPDNNLVWGVLGIILVGFLLWDMVYRIDPAERGVVLRFGKFVTILEPGPHVRLPRPFEQVRKINVERIETLTTSSAMLTGDENIVDVEVAVQYRITDPVDYLFKISDPETSVQHIAESAIRDVIGQSKLDFVITEGRAEIATQAQALSQEMLDHYQSGVMITSFNMQPAKPPEEVKAAFDDATKAREDQHRKINEGEAYRNEVVERAAGEGARIRLDAEGYKSRVVAQAEGEAARFSALLVEYDKAPVVTRKRLYMDAMEEVMSGTSKVVTDNKGGGNIVYLPLDKMLGRNAANGDAAPAAAEAAPTETTPATYTQPPSSEDAMRDRRLGRSRVTR